MITRSKIIALATDVLKQSGRRPTKMMIHPLDALGLGFLPGDEFCGMTIVKDEELPPNMLYLE